MSVNVDGEISHDDVDRGQPVKIGGKASDVASPAAVAAGDRVNAWFTKNGALVACLGSANGPLSAAGQNSTMYVVSDNGSYYTLAVQNHCFDGTQYVAIRGDTVGTYVVPKPTTSGGMSKSRVVSGTTGVIKASAGQLYGIHLENTNAAKRYVHLYNKATAPTLSTDTPVMTIVLAATSSKDILLNDHGSEFTTGISWAYTTDDVAIPTTAGTSGELHFTVHYK